MGTKNTAYSDSDESKQGGEQKKKSFYNVTGCLNGFKPHFHILADSDNLLPSRLLYYLELWSRFSTPPLIFYLIRWWISRVILCDSVNSFQRGPIMERADIVFHPWWFSRRISDERSQEIILELEYYHWGKKIFDKNVGGKWAVFQPKGVDGKKGCRTALPELIMFSLNKSCSFIDSYFQPVFVSIN